MGAWILALESVLLYSPQSHRCNCWSSLSGQENAGWTDLCVWLRQDREAPGAPSKKRSGGPLFNELYARVTNEGNALGVRRRRTEAAESENEVSLSVLGVVGAHRNISMPLGSAGRVRRIKAATYEARVKDRYLV